MADEQIIVEVTYKTEDAQKNVSELTKDIVELENANKDLKKQLKEGEISQEEYSKALEANRVELAKNKAERRDNIKFLQAEGKSQDALQKSVKLMTNERKKLNLETEEGRKRAEELNKKIDQAREITNEHSSALEKTKNNIGKYTESIKQALAGTGLFNDQLSQITQFMPTLSAGFGQAEKGGSKFRGILLKISKVPIILILSAIVAAIAAIGSAIGRNEGFMNKFKEIMSGISNVVNEVVGRIGKLVKVAGKFFKGQISLNEAVEEGKDAFDDMGESMRKAYEEGVELEKLQRQIIKNNITNTTELAKLNSEYEKQRGIADDATRSFQEREEANKKASEAARAAAQIELDALILANQEVEKRIAIAERQGRINDTLRQEEANAVAARIAAEANLTRVIFENEKVRRELRQDDFEQELDFILDVADVRKTANEKLIADEKVSFAARQKLLEETQGFIDESFNQQIALFENYANINIDVNRLLKANNKESFEYARSLGLSEIATNRLLEVIRERIMATSDLNEAQTALFESQKQFISEANAELDTFFEKEAEFEDASVNAFIANEEKKTEATKREQEKRADIIANAYIALTSETANFLAGEEKNLKDFSKILAKALLDQLQAIILAKQAEILVRSLATADSIATFGATGGARAALIIAGVQTAFAVAKAGIQRLDDGGQVKFGTFGGRYHSAGGNNLYDGSGNLIANVERDENFYVMKRDASAHINALSRINEGFGGRSWTNTTGHAQQGGNVDVSAGSGMTPQEVVRMLQNLNLEVKVTDIQAGLVGNQQANSVGVV